MRVLRSGATAAVLAMAVAGCGEPVHRPVSTREARPVVATVVARVPGMT
jgi:hypothetical protein